MDYTIPTCDMATHIAGRTKKSTTEEKVLDQCQSNYGDALAKSESAMVAIGRNKKAMANYMFSSTIMDFSTCQQGFLKVPGISSMLEHDELLVKMADNCVAGMELL